MSNSNRNIEREIAEGLARSEKMLRRQRMTTWVIILGFVLAVFLTFICCTVVGLLILAGPSLGNGISQ